MRNRLPVDVEEILERGAFCSVATGTRSGPHVTPMVFALAGGRVWVTTSRGSVKARAWRTDPAVGGLVRSGDVAVAFTGHVRTFDLLEVESWGRDLLEAPALAMASTRFTRKNARFFAGYAVDARHVPLSWTPPGRVFAAVELDRAVVLGHGGVAETFGSWPRSWPSIERFRAARAGAGALEGLPPAVLESLGTAGEGALALEGTGGLVVLPSAWGLDGAGLYAGLGEAEIALAGLRSPSARAALSVDRASWWRARDMTGTMVRGTAEVAAPASLRSGRGSAERVLRAVGAEPEGSALVRLRPERLVWWRGWSSGTVTVA